jgi:MoxR-like ATPase
MNQAAAAPRISGQIQELLRTLDEIVLGKPDQIRLSLACLVAGGHLLIEDLPGMGKTTLAHALAAVTGAQFHRIQFTSDLLPADIIGVSVYEAERSGFRFHPGPIFAQVVLADEINRATPKAQSALLEAMEERQVTADGETYALPKPFFVIATQNPHHLVGTFPLPESQLDRFLMRIEMGFPDRAAERALLTGRDRRELYRNAKPVVDAAQLLALQERAHQVNVSEALLEYAQDLLAATRSDGRFVAGLSPRAGLGLLQAARAWALIQERDLVLPEDIQAVAPAVMSHRLHTVDGESGPAIVRDLIESVSIP